MPPLFPITPEAMRRARLRSGLKSFQRQTPGTKESCHSDRCKPSKRKPRKYRYADEVAR
jgi:hypothetical protein